MPKYSFSKISSSFISLLKIELIKIFNTVSLSKARIFEISFIIKSEPKVNSSTYFNAEFSKKNIFEFFSFISTLRKVSKFSFSLIILILFKKLLLIIFLILKLHLSKTFLRFL